MSRPFITPGELADMLMMSTTTLQRWRARGTGPSYIKVGGGILYRIVVVEAWLQSCTVRTNVEVAE